MSEIFFLLSVTASPVSSSRQDLHSTRPCGYDVSPQGTLDAQQHRQPSLVSHAKQSSHDSGGSKSSGGHSSDRQGSRPDLRSVEYVMSTNKEDLHKPHPRDIDGELSDLKTSLV